MKKNQTILKDELVLFNSDKSAVITELRKLRKEHEQAMSELVTAQQEEVEVKRKTKTESTRLSELRSRVVFVSGELTKLEAELVDSRKTGDNLRIKRAQESKLHLGRIKNLDDKEDKLLSKIEELKTVYDRNSSVFTNSLSDVKKKYREADKAYVAIKKELEALDKQLIKNKEEDKKITKDRLKREDKLRVREKLVSLREEGLNKREEDIVNMGSDMTIVYSRLKELYFEVDPDTDLDKLITQI